MEEKWTDINDRGFFGKRRKPQLKKDISLKKQKTITFKYKSRNHITDFNLELHKELTDDEALLAKTWEIIDFKAEPFLRNLKLKAQFANHDIVLFKNTYPYVSG